MIVQRGEFANYLRKNSGVKGDATSSEIQGTCSAKLDFTPERELYTESETNSIGLLDSGTMRYRPPFLRVGREKNKPYHPVKPLCSTMHETIGRQCHRWLPSPVVQMLKKVRNTSSA
jgi:hypothetical protein